MHRDSPQANGRPKLPLIDTLRTLDSISDIEHLKSLVLAISMSDLNLQPGWLPDSPVILLIKRIMTLDFNEGFALVRRLWRPTQDSPFRVGYFQLTLSGVLIANCRGGDAEFRQWVWDEIRFLRTNGNAIFTMHRMAQSLVAGLYAVGMAIEENTEAGRAFLKTELDLCLSSCDGKNEKKDFLRFIEDCFSSVLAGNDPAAALRQCRPKIDPYLEQAAKAKLEWREHSLLGIAMRKLVI